MATKKSTKSSTASVKAGSTNDIQKQIVTINTATSTITVPFTVTDSSVLQVYWNGKLLNLNYDFSYADNKITLLDSKTAAVGDKFTFISTAIIKNYSTTTTVSTNTFIDTITGNGKDTEFSIKHDLNSFNVLIETYEVTSTNDLNLENATVLVDSVRTDENNIKIIFKSAPESGTVFKVLVVCIDNMVESGV